MAQLGFGLNINETAQEAGYDQFSQGLGDTLKAVAADNWNFNPISSILLYQDILQERRNAVKQDDIFIDRQELNTKYKNLGLFFEQDEPQSVVDIIVQEKKDELRRNSIIDRGSKGALPFAAKSLIVFTLLPVFTKSTPAISPPICFTGDSKPSCTNLSKCFCNSGSTDVVSLFGITS